MKAILLLAVAISLPLTSIALENLNEESIRTLLTERETLIRQQQTEEAVRLFTSNAVITASMAVAPGQSSLLTADEYCKELNDMELDFQKYSITPINIVISENQKTAQVETRILLNVRPNKKRQRRGTWHLDETLTIIPEDGDLKISEVGAVILRQTLEPDELYNRIMARISQAGGIKKDEAVELLKEALCTYGENHRNSGKSSVQTSFQAMFSVGDEVPALAAQIPDLNFLVLHTGTAITDKGMRYIGQISSLESLIIESTEITDQGITELAPCTNLTSLSLAGTVFTGEALKTIAALPQLEKLRITGGKNMASGLIHLKKSDRLVNLHLQTALTDNDLEILSELPKLKSLSVYGDQITDAGLQHIQALEKLTEIYFMNTGVTYAGTKQLQQERPDLKIGPESLSAPCKYYRGRIEYTKSRWAKDNMKPEDAEPTREELDPLLQRYGGIDAMTCEVGGKISINPIGKGASCTIHGAVEARIPKPPIEGLAKEDFDIDGATVGRWTMDLEAAQKLAQEKQLPLLINFTGSDWCYWCKLMEKNVFTKAEWKTYATNNIIMVLIDFPRDKSLVPEKYKERNEKLKNQYEVRGYPTFILLRPDGKAEISRLKAGRDKTAASFIKEINTAIAEAHKAYVLEYPGFRPSTEYAADFAQNIAASKFAVLSTITRYIQPRQDNVKISRSSVATDRIIEFFEENNLGTAEKGFLKLDLGKTPKGGQFTVFNQTIETIGAQMDRYQGDADYILIFDILRVYRDAWGLHCYILDRNGRNVFSFLLNSHHKPFTDAAIQVKTSTKEGRETMFAECIELLLNMLQQQIIIERDIAAYTPDPAIAGKYIGTEDPATNYIILKKDGSFEFADDGHHGAGKYAVVTGNVLILIKDGQNQPAARFLGDKLITNEGQILTRSNEH